MGAKTYAKREAQAGDDDRQRLLAGLPVGERRLELAGIDTAVLEGGEGPPIVLLHGPGEFAAKWMRVIPGLVGRHRVIAPDLPAHGASGVPRARLDPRLALAWLEDLIAGTCSELRPRAGPLAEREADAGADAAGRPSAPTTVHDDKEEIRDGA